MHTNTHTPEHQSDIHTYIHAYIHTYIHTYRHAYIQTTYMQTWVHTDRQPDRQAGRHKYMHTYIHTHRQTYKHTYIQSSTERHTGNHTYIHTATHTDWQANIGYSQRVRGQHCVCLTCCCRNSVANARAWRFCVTANPCNCCCVYHGWALRQSDDRAGGRALWCARPHPINGSARNGHCIVTVILGAMRVW